MNKAKKLRLSTRLSIRKFAEEVGVHYQTINNIENDKVKMSDITAQKYADYFKCSIEDVR